MKTLNRTVSILGLAGAALLWTAPAQAQAQQVCFTHAEAAKQLEQRFDEKVVGRGLARQGRQMLEIFVSEKGSWTLMVSEPNGRSCVLGSGEGWQQVPLLVGDPA